MGTGASSPKNTSVQVSQNKKNNTSRLQSIKRKFDDLEKDDLDINEIADLLHWLDTAELMVHNDKMAQSPGSKVPEKVNDVKWGRLVDEVTRTAEEKNTLLNSLSEIAGARLKNNNPNITDLSDKNRSSKIAERFSELYDNQWTDVIEEIRVEHLSLADEPLKDEVVETDCIDFLLNILIEIFRWCKKTSQDQLFRLVKTFIPTATKDKERWDQDITKRCKDFWKGNMSTEESLKLIEKQIDEEVMGNFRERYPNTANGQHFKSYWQTCAELCWFMNIQDPPVHMIYEYKENQPGKENKSKETAKELFRAYTCSGSPLKYIVWPTLQLYKNGPMLYKGVAQFEPKESSV